MTDADTKERLLRAAERTFTEHGLAGFSVRAVTAAAGANVAAVNYHFGSKAGLLRQLVRRVFEGVAAEQLRALHALHAGAAAPPLAAIVEAYAGPVFALFDSPRAAEWGEAWMASREAGGAEPHLPPMMFQDSETTRAYLEAFRRASPAGGAPEELWWRFARATNLLIAHEGTLSRRPRATEADRAAVAGQRRWMVAFLAAALAAPPTPDA